MWPLFLIVLGIVFLGLELWCLRTGRPTLSQRVRAWSIRWPIIPIVVSFAAGVVAGHWWWPL